MTKRLEPLLVIAGVTASGKTGAAIELAHKLGGELIGADSVQVYRGFDIGSAKPRQRELGELRHHLIDVIDPDQDMDAVGYAALADEAIRSIRDRDRLPIVVGGTGLWIRALVRGLVDVPPPDPNLRRSLEAAVAAEGPAALHARLAEVDPISARAVHPNDSVRIIRALEVYQQTGTAFGSLRARHALGASRYRTVFVVLDMERRAHTEAIEQRTLQMLEAGWIGEVQALVARWGDRVRPLGSVGYREVLAHVRDGIPIAETIQQIRKSTRTYARRQRTWFRGEPGVSWWSHRVELEDPRSVERIAKDLEL